MWPGPRPTSISSGILIRPAIWPQYMVQKVGVPCPPPLGGAGSQSNTMSPELRPTTIPSGKLIHPAVWPQQTWAKKWGAVPLLGELGLTQCGHKVNRFWATVCKTVRHMLSDRCPVCLSVLSVLSVTLVYYGQTVGCIKMKLGTEIGLGPGETVSDGHPASP